MLRNNPEKVRYTLIDQAKEVIGTYGSARVRVIKAAFRTVIDHLVPLESKLCMAIFDNIPLSKWVRVMKARK